jgi:hypothetical protein
MQLIQKITNLIQTNKFILQFFLILSPSWIGLIRRQTKFVESVEESYDHG